MTSEDVEKYCTFYKGECFVPSSISDKDEIRMWRAEKYVCEEVAHLIDENNPRKSILSYIEAYISKWAPYDCNEILSKYIHQSSDNFPSEI